MTDETVEVMLIEDSEDDAAFIFRALRKADLASGLRKARDGAEALAQLFGDCNTVNCRPLIHPRLIILDLKLPKVDGLELLRRLKANPYTRAIPVVILSSSQEKRDLSESYLLGANSFLVKPVNFDEFSETVRILAHYWLRFNRTIKA